LERFKPRVVSFHFGLPDDRLLQRIKRWGAMALASATTVAEGHWLARHGADAVIAQGIEAGGHRGHFLSMDLTLQPTTRELVRGLVDAIDVPVIAAGGIAHRDDVFALREAGASAVQVGTAYLRCAEATTSAVHRAALDDAQNHETALTNLFSGRPARGLMNRLMRELGPLSDQVPAFPLASVALTPLRAHAERLGRGDFSPLWAGMKIAAIGTPSAAALTRKLAGSPLIDD
ncbi:MAG: nitronate monooxygenase, partial [Tahibacter sp.]